MQRFSTLAPAYNLPWRAFQRYLPGLPRLSWLKLVSAGIISITSLPLLYLLLRASASGQAGIDYLLQARTLSILGNSLLLTVAGFGLATIVFGFSKSFWLSFAMLFLTGVFDNVSMVIR